MDGANGGLFQMFQGVFDVRALNSSFRGNTRAVQLLAKTKLQLAGGFIGERNSDNTTDGGEAVSQHRDNARDQLGGFAGAGRGFDQQAFSQGVSNALAGGAVVQLRLLDRGCCHGECRIWISGSSRSCGFRFTRVSS
jgi:hypothetical protein